MKPPTVWGVQDDRWQQLYAALDNTTANFKTVDKAKKDVTQRLRTATGQNFSVSEVDLHLKRLMSVMDPGGKPRDFFANWAEHKLRYVSANSSKAKAASKCPGGKVTKIKLKHNHRTRNSSRSSESLSAEVQISNANAPSDPVPERSTPNNGQASCCCRLNR